MTKPTSATAASASKAATELPRNRKCALFWQYAQDEPAKWRKLIGTQIEHRTYGKGTIVAIIGHCFCVSFRDRTNKTLSDEQMIFPMDKFSKSSVPDFIDLAIPEELSDAISLHRETAGQQAMVEEKRRVDDAERANKQAIKSRPEEQEQKYSREFRALCGSATSGFPSQEFHISKFPAKLEDLRLAAAWAKVPIDSTETDLDTTKQALLALTSRQQKEIARTLSARIAERAFCAFLSQMGYQVQDISVTQLGSSEPDLWRSYDILVEGHPIDVKNVRQPPFEANRFSEHRVQKPGKSLHRTNSRIRIAGVRSPSLEAHHLMCHETIPGNYQCREIRILGISPDNAQFEKLLRELGTENLEVDFRRVGDHQSLYLPDWVFSFPKRFYTFRNQYLSQIVNRKWPTNQSFWRRNRFNLLPCLIAAGIGLDDERYNTASLESWERQLVEQLVSYQRRDELVLPFIYLSVLWYFVQATLHPSAARTLGSYRQLLFWDAGAESAEGWPLFVYDPRNTVSNLLDALEYLWHKRESVIKSFKQYRLYGTGILHARRERGEPWQTLVAYCGNCGKTPLVSFGGRYFISCSPTGV